MDILVRPCALVNPRRTRMSALEKNLRSMVSGGRVVVEGDPGTKNSANSRTTVEVGRIRTPMDIAKGEGRTSAPRQAGGADFTQRRAGPLWPIPRHHRQITAHADGRVTIEKSRCADLKLITKDDGTIKLTDSETTGTLTKVQQGGEIAVSEARSAK